MTDFKNFKGAARKIKDVDLPRIGAEIGVGEDELHAFMDVEAAGSAFDDQGRPKILFEPHVFYRKLAGAERAAAIAQGIAYKNWGEKPYPTDSYPRLVKAIAINETAALEATSWGVTQILGENAVDCGYETPQDLVLAFMDDESEHLEATVKLLVAKSIDDDLRAHNWAGVARGWNGSGFAKNKYDTKMAAAFAKWAKIKDTPYTPAPAAAVVDEQADATQSTATPATDAPSAAPVAQAAPAAAAPAVDVGVVSKVVENLYDGKPHDAVKSVQQKLDDLGYHEVGTIDGAWGSRTAGAITTFQTDNKLTLNPKIDDTLLAALMVAPQRVVAPARANATVADLRKDDVPEIKKNDQTQYAALIGGGTAALGVGGKVLDQAQQYSDFLHRTADFVNPAFNFVQDNWWVVLGAIVIFVGYRAYQLKEIRLAKHQTGEDVSE